MNAMQRLTDILSELNEDELAIVTRFAERINAGRTAYAPLALATDKRDFVEEAMQEVLDLAAYSAMHLRRASAVKP